MDLTRRTVVAGASAACITGVPGSADAANPALIFAVALHGFKLLKAGAKRTLDWCAENKVNEEICQQIAEEIITYAVQKAREGIDEVARSSTYVPARVERAIPLQDKEIEVSFLCECGGPTPVSFDPNKFVARLYTVFEYTENFLIFGERKKTGRLLETVYDPSKERSTSPAFPNPFFNPLIAPNRNYVEVERLPNFRSPGLKEIEVVYDGVVRDTQRFYIFDDRSSREFCRGYEFLCG